MAFRTAWWSLQRQLRRRPATAIGGVSDEPTAIHFTFGATARVAPTNRIGLLM